MKETDLYFPVKQLFESLDYEVYSEVSNMDVIAVKGDEMLVVELKTSFNLKLLTQAVLRQKLSEHVYVAIPAPSFKKRCSKEFKNYEHLLKRLELGLILVHFTSTPYAVIEFDPNPFDRAKSMRANKKYKRIALKELSKRHGDNNIGGTNGKLVTAYREQALLTLYYLSQVDEMKVSELRKLTGNKKVQQLLYNNYYGWFERVRKGVYRITDIGRQALTQYDSVIVKLNQR